MRLHSAWRRTQAPGLFVSDAILGKIAERLSNVDAQASTTRSPQCLNGRGASVKIRYATSSAIFSPALINWIRPTSSVVAASFGDEDVSVPRAK
jgi:hypothetical protein